MKFVGLSKKSLPATNRNKNIFRDHLATFMLHKKRKGFYWFAIFMEHATQLYGEKEGVPLVNR